MMPIVLIPKHRRAGIASICTVAFLCCLMPAGCHAPNSAKAQKGLLITSHVDLKSYVHSTVGANGHRETKIYFPLLQIYDALGNLVYVGHDSRQNSKALEGLADGTDKMTPVSGASSLTQAISDTPAFSSEGSAIAHTNRPTIISVFLEDCHACSVQEEALDKTQEHLQEQGINLLIVRVSKPS